MALGKYIETELGRLYIAEEQGCIVRITCCEAPEEDTLGDSSLLEQAAAEVREYLAGKRKVFSTPVNAKGTPFQKAVWEALQKIPFGETRSYGEIAREIGSPRGARAVGMACNRNPILLMIPCHRVVGSTGKLVGFAVGLPRKKWLLGLEGKRFFE